MTAADHSSMLPALHPEERQHCEAVQQALGSAIRTAGGWLRFDDYLQLVLYAPGLGYYSAGARKFGSQGDFVTAPELSGLFGSCVARQCAQILQECGGDILEFGAGSGALAEQVLRGLAQLQSLPAHYYIMEVSAELRARQQQRLSALAPELAQRVQWLERLPVSGIVGIVLANEVADALPFRRFVREGDALLERGVALSVSGELMQQDHSAPPELYAELSRMGLEWQAPYSSELCLLLQPWIVSLGACLARGAVLLFDYGLSRRELYHPQRAHGTLRCHFRHRAHDDPLRYPGLQDITCWVDFTRVAEGADAAQLQVAGYCTQAAFLLANGIEREIAQAADTRTQALLASQARALLLPGEMGESFKLMTLTRQLQQPLQSAALQDLRHLL